MLEFFYLINHLLKQEEDELIYGLREEGSAFKYTISGIVDNIFASCPKLKQHISTPYILNYMIHQADLSYFKEHGIEEHYNMFMNLRKLFNSNMNSYTIKGKLDLAKHFEFLRSLTYEEAHMALLSSNLDLIKIVKIGQGLLGKTAVDLRTGLREVILNPTCSYVIFAHNHPTGSVSPSKEDVNISVRFMDLCKSMNVDLLDCIIVTPMNPIISFMGQVTKEYDKRSS